MLNHWPILQRPVEEYIDAFLKTELEEIPLANLHIQSAMWVKHGLHRNKDMVLYLAQAIKQWPQLRETRSHIYQRRQTEKEWTYLPTIISALDWSPELFAVLVDALLTPYVSDENISTHKHLLPYDRYAPATQHIQYCSENTIMSHAMGKTMQMAFSKEDRKRVLLRWFSVQPSIWSHVAAGTKALGLGYIQPEDEYYNNATTAYKYYYDLCMQMYPEQEQLWLILRDGLFEHWQWWSTIATIESISKFGEHDMLELPLEA